MYLPSNCGTDPGSVVGGWWLVAGGGWDWFYNKTNGFSNLFGLFACKTNGFSTLLSENSVKPMLFQQLLNENIVKPLHFQHI